LLLYYINGMVFGLEEEEEEEERREISRMV
jgi:hypothetical protein